MLNTLFPPWPSFTDEEVDAVAAVLKSNRVNYWTGEISRNFEREFAAWANVRHAVAVANGTVALDLALRALDIGNGDDVIVTPRSYFASVSSVVNAGARPIFADVDWDSQNLTPTTVETVLTAKTRAILCVHLAGWPCDMPALMNLAKAYRLSVIEDCAQAHGATFMGRPVGSFGDVAAWSFCQDKIMTTGGEGGMAGTSEEELWKKMWSFKDHGKSWEAVNRIDHPPGFRWLHESFGTNWRITEMQSAIGRIQLRRMGEWHQKRTTNALFLAEGLRQCGGVRVPIPGPEIEHAWYRFYVFVERTKLKAGWDRDRILGRIIATGVPCFAGSCSEIYREKAFDGTGWRPAQPLPVARELGETSLAFLVHPTLGPEHLERTVEVVHEIMAEATW